MPVYEYIEGGRVVARRLPVEERDRFPGRIVVPRTVRVLTGTGRTEAEWQASEVLRGFYREEQKNPRLNDTVRAALGMNADGVKDTWAQPDAEYPEAGPEVRERARAE